MRIRSFTYSFFVVGLLWLTSSFSGGNDHASLTVKITNIHGKRGVIEIGLYDNSKLFPKVGKTLQMVRIKPQGSVLTYKFKGLHSGKYAVCIYHDSNGDKRCNKNWIGIPTEAYAFSRNFRPKFSAPTFSDCSVSLKEARMITIRMVY
jgi:uncharacterized protein (DUF2141 family)